MNTQPTQRMQSGDHGSESPDDEPLDRAFEAIRGAFGRRMDPLSESTARQLWRKIVARNAVREWLTKIEEDAQFCRALHLGVPEDDIEALEEFKTVASMASTRGALYVLGLVNERLERLRSTANNPVRVSFAGTIPGAAGTQASTHGFRGFPCQQRYEGFICARVQDRAGEWISGTSDYAGRDTRLPSGVHCRLAVWMQPDRPADAWAETVLVESGISEDIVTFTFEADCATLQLPYGRKRVHFHRADKSPLVLFDFRTPRDENEHVAYVHVLQEMRLVKSLFVILHVSHTRREVKRCVRKAKKSSG